MARGSDAATLEAENRALYGQHLNCTDLILANDARYDPAVQRVLADATDEEATAEVMKHLGKYKGRFDLREGEKLIAAAVHGAALAGVIELPDGRHRKAIAPYDEEAYEPPVLSEAEEAQRVRAQQATAVAAETQRIRDEQLERVEEARREAQATADAEIAKIREESEAEVAKAREAAQAAAEPSVEKTAEKAKAPARASGSRSGGTPRSRSGSKPAGSK